VAGFADAGDVDATAAGEGEGYGFVEVGSEGACEGLAEELEAGDLVVEGSEGG
jgi:hypothetical protein